jgi:DNA-directed RNA polymerase specialized sigma54-like protein
MIGLGLGLELGLEQKLTPQQVQYLKLLQLTGLQLEQHLHQELEMNPMIEEGGDLDFEEDTELTSVETIAEDTPTSDDDTDTTATDDEPKGTNDDDFEAFDAEKGVNDDEQTWIDFIEDEGNPAKYNSDDEDGEGFPMPETRTMIDELDDQLRMLNLTEEEQIVSEEILGSLEPSGYLPRDVHEICTAVNEKIDALNDLRKREYLTHLPSHNGNGSGNGNGKMNGRTNGTHYHASAYADNYKDFDAADFEATEDYLDNLDLSPVSRKPVQPPAPTMSASLGTMLLTPELANPANLLQYVTVETVERVLLIIQTLEPPGIGARDLRECLLAQFRALPKLNAAQRLAQQVLMKTYEAFKMKHYEVIMRELKVSDVYLREALKAIRTLNPKPGGGEVSGATGSIVPDFLIMYDEEKNDFLIQLNDSRVPTVRVNKTYEQMKNQVRDFTQRGMKSQRMNTDTRKFLKQKYDDAKFLIQALKQRRHTMVRVMTAIIHRQREFFIHGKNYIRPLIYKDIAEDTGVDISTVCRVVNNKYTQTDYGVYELRYFFSEGLPMPKDVLAMGTKANAGSKANPEALRDSLRDPLRDDALDGDNEVSTRVIKDKLKELIGIEPKNKPLSDEKLVDELKTQGYEIARRTVAKYRDLMGIPPARLRREL